MLLDHATIKRLIAEHRDPLELCRAVESALLQQNVDVHRVALCVKACEPLSDLLLERMSLPAALMQALRECQAFNAQLARQLQEVQP